MIRIQYKFKTYLILKPTHYPSQVYVHIKEMQISMISPGTLHHKEGFSSFRGFLPLVCNRKAPAKFEEKLGQATTILLEKKKLLINQSTRDKRL